MTDIERIIKENPELQIYVDELNKKISDLETRLFTVKKKYEYECTMKNTQVWEETADAIENKKLKEKIKHLTSRLESINSIEDILKTKNIEIEGLKGKIKNMEQQISALQL